MQIRDVLKAGGLILAGSVVGGLTIDVLSHLKKKSKKLFKKSNDQKKETK
jgi:hypothetical protein